MLNVIKKNESTEPFDPQKIETSIINSAAESDYTMSDKEASLVVDRVKKKIISMRGNDGLTSTFEIRSILDLALRLSGYEKIADIFSTGRPDRLGERK